MPDCLIRHSILIYIYLTLGSDYFPERYITTDGLASKQISVSRYDAKYLLLAFEFFQGSLLLRGDGCMQGMRGGVHTHLYIKKGI